MLEPSGGPPVDSRGLFDAVGWHHTSRDNPQIPLPPLECLRSLSETPDSPFHSGVLSEVSGSLSTILLVGAAVAAATAAGSSAENCLLSLDSHPES